MSDSQISDTIEGNDYNLPAEVSADEMIALGFTERGADLIDFYNPNIPEYLYQMKNTYSNLSGTYLKFSNSRFELIKRTDPVKLIKKSEQ